jgi:putative membrane protein
MADRVDERDWWARRLLPGGQEPDPRFSLANERTFLAWIRTAMALIAGGIAIEAFAIEIFEPAVRKGISLLLIVLGMFVSGGAFMRWLGVERAMRHSRPLPLPLIAPVLGLGAAVSAIVLALFIITTAP